MMWFFEGVESPRNNASEISDMSPALSRICSVALSGLFCSGKRDSGRNLKIHCYLEPSDSSSVYSFERFWLIIEFKPFPIPAQGDLSMKLEMSIEVFENERGLVAIVC